MKIALIQTNPLIGDFTANCEKIARSASRAKEAGCELAIFPELAIAGYPPQDLLERGSFLADHDLALTELIAGIRGIGIITGAITRHTAECGKPLHNSAVFFKDGRILATAHKRLLPTYDVFDEARYFEPGSRSTTIQFIGKTIALSICEDIWNDKDTSARPLYNLDPLPELISPAGGKANLLVNLAASPFRHGKIIEKHRMFRNICRKYDTPLLYVNQVGGQDSLLFDGHSLAMDRSGEVRHMAAGFTEDMLVIDSEELVGGTGENIIPEPDNLADVHAALVMGTRDYLGKCGFKTGIIGLSGGIDSALTAAIACEALGQRNITGVALPSRYSSAESVEDAQRLAENLGIDFEILPIEDIFRVQLETLAPLLGELHQDITEQNLQARIRGNLLMAISNRRGSMLLSTGNKSELAVGYCTLYGDMSGGLAVISDVPKGMVYDLARYVNRSREIIPARTIEKPPSAELAPNQLDQDDLPPYEVLDPVVKAWLEENRSISEIVASGYDRNIVSDIIRRIRRNEYKRKQAPMGLKVTSKAFGYGRRYPTAENYRERE
ncbi:MAG: NAD+ synthase [Proteobacteria bacterium]|nr:NAD+ synthase [Pseudomonadota bacterium]MBU1737596.1 NAD+ synthase [Pseudomonadota bacterium]